MLCVDTGHDTQQCYFAVICLSLHKVYFIEIMREKLKQVSEVVATANDKFFEQYTQVDTLVGIIDKALRKQGMEADAVTIDAPVLDKKIVFLLHDAKAETIDCAIGNVQGDIHSSVVISMDAFNCQYVIDLMTSTFITSH